MCELKRKKSSETQPKLIKHLRHQKYLLFFLYQQKTYQNNYIEVIVNCIGTLWLNERHVGEKLGNKNLTVITNITQYIKSTDMNQYK